MLLIIQNRYLFRSTTKIVFEIQANIMNSPFVFNVVVCINTLYRRQMHICYHMWERTCVHHRLIISIWWQVETRIPFRPTCSRIYYQLYVTTTTNLTKLLPNSILLNSLNELRAKLLCLPTTILEMCTY